MKEKLRHENTVQIAKALGIGKKPKDVENLPPDWIDEHKYIIVSFMFYKNAVSQSKVSFRIAWISSLLAFIFFVVAGYFLLHRPLPDANAVSVAGATISAIGGAIAGLIGGVNFYLYGMTSTQFSSFHARLDRLQRFTMAELLVERIKNSDTQDTAIAALVNSIATAPLADTQTYIQPLQPSPVPGQTPPTPPGQTPPTPPGQTPPTPPGV